MKKIGLSIVFVCLLLVGCGSNEKATVCTPDVDGTNELSIRIVADDENVGKVEITATNKGGAKGLSKEEKEAGISMFNELELVEKGLEKAELTTEGDDAKVFLSAKPSGLLLMFQTLGMNSADAKELETLNYKEMIDMFSAEGATCVEE